MRIVLKNTSSKALRDIIYLDTPDKLVNVEDGAKYTITQGSKTQELPLKKIDSEEYDF